MNDTLDASIKDKLDARYGRRQATRSRGAVIAVGALVLAVLLGSVAWSTVSSSLTALRADGTGFVVPDERTAVVSFEVSGPPDSEIVCALEALDVEHGVVGWRIVQYPAAPERTRAFTEEIPTVAEATTGLVSSCWIP